MSNPIEELRRKRELEWERARATEAKKPNPGATIPLAAVQRDAVNFLRDAHRAVRLDEISQRVRFDVGGNAELLDSLKAHPRVKMVPGGLFAYRARYECANVAEMQQLIDESEGGVLATELVEAYTEAAADMKRLVAEGKVLSFRNKELKSDVLFGCYAKYDVGVPQSLKDSWHATALPDVNKLKAELTRLKLPAAEPPPVIKPKRRGRKAEKKGPRVVKDPYNAHVPPVYTNDEWKGQLTDKQQIYGKH